MSSPATNSDQPRRPVRPRFGRVPGFGQRIHIPTGACPTCGAFPPCETPGQLADVEHCRDSACPDADWPHPAHE